MEAVGMRGGPVMKRNRLRFDRYPPIHRLLLQFSAPDMEQCFRRDYLVYVLPQARLSLLLGALIYLLMAAKDPLFHPDSYLQVWAVRGAVAWIMFSALALTYLPSAFRQFGSTILAVTAVCAGLGTLVMVQLGAPADTYVYFPGVILTVIWAYTFSGLRFLPALAVNGILLLASAAALMLPALDAVVVLSCLAHFLAGSVIAGFAGYVIEWQRRALYHEAARLDQERRSHARQASRDALTGLPNRLLFQQRLTDAEARSRSTGHPFAVLFIDINDFKPVNDRYGHRVGDRVLGLLGQRLQGAIRGADTVARFGGDEFTVLLEGLDAVDRAEMLADSIVASVSRPCVVEGPDGRVTIDLGVSIGIAVFPRDADSGRGLLVVADAAMYDAKSAGGGYRAATG
jgi:diguanylate cyclase (GGDEF)-like protein